MDLDPTFQRVFNLNPAAQVSLLYSVLFIRRLHICLFNHRALWSPYFAIGTGTGTLKMSVNFYQYLA
jgi:hypothetical protein